MDKDRRARTFQRIERATELPMLVLALVMIPLIILPFAVDLPRAMDRAFLAADWLIWAAFASELVTKTYLAPERRVYLRRHWIDVLIVLIPFLRPLRATRSLRALRVLRLLWAVVFLLRFLVSARTVFGRHGLHYALGAGTLIVIVVAGAVALVEHSAAGRSIGDFPTALWWATTTVTTVGYGDTAPITAEGRALGVLLMLVGVALFSMITANVAALFVASDRDVGAAQSQDADALEAQLASVERELAQLRSILAPPTGA